MRQLHSGSLVLVAVLIAMLCVSCSQENAPQAAPLPTEFPNEDEGLISPEGQAIIDAVRDGRIEAPELITEPLNILPDNSLTPQGGVPYAVQVPFRATIGNFWRYRSLRQPSYANWNTDYCSSAPESGPFFNFTKSCTRHDYGYSNWKKYNAFTTSAKTAIDYRFLRDMKDYCGATYAAWFNYPAKNMCYSVAYIYYGAVRVHG
jgi:hypothetical protein